MTPERVSSSDGPAREGRKRRAAKLCVVAAVALSSIVAAGGIAWAAIDTRPQPIIDEYVRKTVVLADALASRPVSEYPVLLYRATIGPRLPLYQGAAALCVLGFGRTVDSMLVVNAVAIVLLGLVTFRIAWILEGPVGGLIATAIVLTYPITLNLAKLARAHSLLPAVGALALLAAIGNALAPTVSKAWMLAGSLLLVFAVHASGLYTLAGVVGVATVLGVVHLGERMAPGSVGTFGGRFLAGLRGHYVTRGLLPAAVVSGVLLAGWLAIKWEQFRGLVDVAQAYFAGREGSLFYLATMPLALSPFSSATFLIAYVGLAVRFARRQDRDRRTGFLLLVPPLMFFGANAMFGGKSWDTFSIVLAALAVTTAVGTIRIVRSIVDALSSSGAGSAAAGSIAFVFGVALVLNYTVSVWGVPKNEHVLRLLGVYEMGNGRRFFYPDPPQRGGWETGALARIMLRTGACTPGPCSVSFISERYDYFHGEALDYEMLLEDRRARMRATQPGERLGDSPAWLTADFVVYLERGPGGQTGARRGEPEDEPAIAVVKRGSQDRTGLLREYEGQLPTGETVVLMKRVRTLSAGEVSRLTTELREAESRT